MITIERLRELFSYDPMSGSLCRVAKSAKTANNSKSNGSVREDGYLYIKADAKPYMAHRICWAIHYGKFPDGLIDHINGIRNDNRIENLRDIDAVGNSMNRARQSNNSSGYIGVSWHKDTNKWIAYIRVKGKQKYLGLYADAESASFAYRQAAQREFGKYARQGSDASTRRSAYDK